MILDQIIVAAKVEPEVNRAIEKMFADNEALYAEAGFADDWIEDVIARQRCELEAWKAEKLRGFRDWIMRDGSLLQ